MQITQPTAHLFDSTSDAYDASQTRDDIRDGDLLVVESERVVGFLHRAWPVALSDEHGAFHTLAPDADVTCLGKSDARTLTYTVHPDDAEPYEHTEHIAADPGIDYTASVELARELIDEQREHFALVDAMSDEQRAYFDEHDERSLASMFPLHSRVVVDHPFSRRELARGEIVGHVLGLYDFGSPESGPGPLERTELLRVRCDDDSYRNAYPGDVEPERDERDCECA